MKKHILFMLGGAVLLVIAVTHLAGINTGGKTSSKDVKCEADLQFLSAQLRLYKGERGNYPATSEGLNALTIEPTNNAFHQFMDSIPLDPWGHAYQYKYPANVGGDTVDLYSLGPDGIRSGDDRDAPRQPEGFPR